MLAARSGRAFTMVELALCLGIMAFSLVAIMGVLPTGLRVQRDNREETIINQEGTFLLEALRGGARGLNDLTNYVDQITISNAPSGKRRVYVNEPRRADGLNTGRRILGLLSTPKYVIEYNPVKLDAGGVRMDPSGTNTNVITARIRALSGPAIEKTPSRQDNDLVFTYQVTSEIIPFWQFHFSNQVDYSGVDTNSAEFLVRSNYWTQARTMRDNYYQLRLTLQWPVLPNPKEPDRPIVGNNLRSFRSMMSGRLVPTNDPVSPQMVLWELVPSAFQPVTNHEALPRSF